MLSEEEEGRLAFLGATKTLGHPVDGEIAVVDVGGGSSEVILGTVPEGVRKVHSFPIGSGSLADSFLSDDPPSAAELREVREHIGDFFEKVEIEQPAQAVAVGGSATSLRQAWSVPCSSTRRSSARCACSPRTTSPRSHGASSSIRAGSGSCRPACCCSSGCPSSSGQPLQIGKGGLREGIILDLLNEPANGRQRGRSGVGAEARTRG